MLQLPGAVCAAAQSMEYSSSLKQTDKTIDFFGNKIAVSKFNPNYVFFTSVSIGSSNLEINVIDYTQVSGATSDMLSVYTKTIGNVTHACKATPASGNQFYLTYAYTYFNGYDFLGFVTSGAESSGKCTDKYGSFFLYKSVMVGGTYTLQDALPTKSGLQAFYNTNMAIGSDGIPPLPVFSGFTKVVDMVFNDHIGTNQPYLVCLIFYEDT